MMIKSRLFTILWVTLVLLGLTACGGAPPAAAPAETPAPTPAPDFSGTDFSGHWYVDEIIDAGGTPVDDGRKEELGAGFILELLPGGVYFVYDEDGKALGQGSYEVEQNELTLTADTGQTVYGIEDAATWRAAQPDGSVTVMKRESMGNNQEKEGQTN